MKKQLRILGASLLAIVMLQVPLLASQTQPCCMKEKAVKQDIVDIAAGNKQFETLVTALKAAGLVDTLKGEGPFTVFAPTNDAFAKLPPGTVESLLKPENKDQLTSILTYHVFPGKVTAEEVLKLDGKEIKMVNGKPAKITVKNGEVFINDAKVIVTDIMAKNGVIHVIDMVIIPPQK